MTDNEADPSRNQRKYLQTSSNYRFPSPLALLPYMWHLSKIIHHVVFFFIGMQQLATCPQFVEYEGTILQDN